MKQYVFSFVLLISGLNLFSQHRLAVVDFSDRYYAQLYVNETEKNNCDNGFVKIIEKHSGKEMFFAGVECFDNDFLDQKRKLNQKEIPYENQEVVIYDDFNFDGIPDFAIRDGFNGNYGSPSYIVYLAEDNGFIFSEEFTRLAQEYDGIFGYDAEKQRLITMAKSGCCWHQYTEYMVKDNKPFPVSVIETDNMAIHPFTVEIQYTWNGTEMDETETIYLDPDISEEIISFELEGSGKIAVLLVIRGNLCFAMLENRKIGKAGFIWPDMKSDIVNQKFFYYPEKNILAFFDTDTEYTVFETDTEVGIDVKVNDKKIRMKGKKSTQRGSLKEIEDLDNIENIRYAFEISSE